jgi:hypothetical protein
LSGDIGTLTGVPVSGTISFQGASYDYTAVPGSSSAFLTLPFEMTTPGSDPNRTITLTGPFHGAASFLDPNFASGTSFIFPGQGTVTANLVLTGNPEVCCRYELQSLHFDFVNVPEPGSFALLGAALLAWRMGQRGRDRSGAEPAD